jgi:hypothetical protein
VAKTKNNPSPTPPPAAPEATARPAPPSSDPAQPAVGFGEQVGDAVTGTVATVRRVLPADRLPVYLAGGALILAGLIDPPAAVAVALGYEALRRWNTAAPRPVRTRASALT